MAQIPQINENLSQLICQGLTINAFFNSSQSALSLHLRCLAGFEYYAPLSIHLKLTISEKLFLGKSGIE